MADTSRGFDEERGETVTARFDWSSTPPSHAIVSAIAAIENVEVTEVPVECDIVLYDYVDPQSLDSLLQREDRTDVSIELSVDGYHVAVDGDELTVTLSSA